MYSQETKTFKSSWKLPTTGKHPQHYVFGITRQSVAESRQQKHSTRAREIQMTYRITCTRNQQSNWLCNPNCWAGIRDGIRTMLRIGLIMTLHPSKGRAVTPHGFIEAVQQYQYL